MPKLSAICYQPLAMLHCHSMEEIRQYVSKKALEMCYALVRVAGSVTNENFKLELERQAMALLTATISEKYSESIVNLKVIKIFLILGLELNYINTANSKILEKQLDEIDAAIAEVRKVAISSKEEINLEGVFSGIKYSAKSFERKEESKSEIEDSKEITVLKEQAKNTNQPISHKIPDEMDAIIGNRQSAILNLIRQYSFAGTGGCQMKDIQGILPGVSERTIRYDLHKLVEQGAIIRNGGGSASAYTMANS